MSNSKLLKVKQELVWLGIVLVLCLMVIIPLSTKNIDFPLLHYNLIYIIVFVLFTRTIFLLKYSLLARAFVLKLIIIFISIPIIVLLIDGMSEFQAFLDEEGLQSIMGHLNFKTQNSLIQFFKSEYIFFGMGSVVAAIVLPIRLIISIWRVRNRGTV